MTDAVAQSAVWGAPVMLTGALFFQVYIFRQAQANNALPLAVSTSALLAGMVGYLGWQAVSGKPVAEVAMLAIVLCATTTMGQMAVLMYLLQSPSATAQPVVKRGGAGAADERARTSGKKSTKSRKRRPSKPQTEEEIAFEAALAMARDEGGTDMWAKTSNMLRVLRATFLEQIPRCGYLCVVGCPEGDSSLLNVFPLNGTLARNGPSIGLPKVKGTLLAEVIEKGEVECIDNCAMKVALYPEVAFLSCVMRAKQVAIIPLQNAAGDGLVGLLEVTTVDDDAITPDLLHGRLVGLAATFARGLEALPMSESPFGATHATKDTWAASSAKLMAESKAGNAPVPKLVWADPPPIANSLSDAPITVPSGPPQEGPDAQLAADGAPAEETAPKEDTLSQLTPRSSAGMHLAPFDDAAPATEPVDAEPPVGSPGSPLQAGQQLVLPVPTPLGASSRKGRDRKESKLAPGRSKSAATSISASVGSGPGTPTQPAAPQGSGLKDKPRAPYGERDAPMHAGSGGLPSNVESAMGQPQKGSMLIVPRMSDDPLDAAAQATVAAAMQDAHRGSPNFGRASSVPVRMSGSLDQRGAGDVETVQLLEVTGKGGFATVFRGIWRDSIVAVKVLELEEHDVGSESTTARNAAEAEMQAKRFKVLLEGAMSCSMNHNCIVQTYTYSLLPRPDGFGQRAVIIMEFCDHGSLADVIANKWFVATDHMGQQWLRWDKLLMTLMDIASAMHYLHALKIVHRDLKPRNILLTSHPKDPRGFVPKISDFGISTIVNTEEPYVSEYATGTVAYMPPELMLDGKVFPSADVYSFGIIMWELYFCCKAFVGLKRPHIVVRVATKNLRPLFSASTPDCYRRLAQECWHQDPAKRPTFKAIHKRLYNIHCSTAGAATASSGAAKAAPPTHSGAPSMPDAY